MLGDLAGKWFNDLTTVSISSINYVSCFSMKYECTVTICMPDTRIPDSSEYRTNWMSGFWLVWVHRHQNNGLPFKNLTFSSSFWKFWVHRCRNAIWKPYFFVWISNGIWKPDHSTTGHIWTIWQPDLSDIRMPTVLEEQNRLVRFASSTWMVLLNYLADPGIQGRQSYFLFHLLVCPSWNGSFETRNFSLPERTYLCWS